MSDNENSETWSLDAAISVIQKVQKLGFEPLKIFGMITETEEMVELSWTKEYETYDDVITRISSACWTGMLYFRWWLQDNCEDAKFKRTYDPNSLNFDNDGVYYVEFAGNESHLFVWIIKGDKLWYAGTYGGVCSLTVKEFDKNEYREKFLRAMKGSMADYSYIFQVTPDQNAVNFEWIAVSKSSRYL